MIILTITCGKNHNRTWHLYKIFIVQHNFYKHNVNITSTVLFLWILLHLFSNEVVELKLIENE